MHGTRPFWPRRNRRRTRVPVKREAAKRESVRNGSATDVRGHCSRQRRPRRAATCRAMPRSADLAARSRVSGPPGWSRRQPTVAGGGGVTPCVAVVAVPTDRIRGDRSGCGARGGRSRPISSVEQHTQTVRLDGSARRRGSVVEGGGVAGVRVCRAGAWRARESSSFQRAARGGARTLRTDRSRRSGSSCASARAVLDVAVAARGHRSPLQRSQPAVVGPPSLRQGDEHREQERSGTSRLPE